MVEPVGRLFVAVPIPGVVRAALVDQLGAVEIPGKPVPAANWHLTLRFLGTTDSVGYDRLLAGLDQRIGLAPFRLALASLGAFPNPRRATVLWVGVTTGGDRLGELASQVEEAVEAAGFEPEERPYRPHLTVSRIRPDADVRRVVDHPIGPLPFTVDQVAVFRSHLGGAHARYEIMERFPLR